ncbi:RE1-silencing transcription factor-like isoform X2 [Vanessa atalanta]|uniref:RE1-silencing transcription factor-like isoform X2 n=1 Tax=Vanessa atalanta TaxID=42275 RepID=UPI001FCDD4ED|nr:RE1-silencing transcription factor-like isoform X2 [Vanessa atalanta]
MEKRKNSLGAVKMCRFCLTQNESLGNLYDRNRSSKSSVNLHLKILSCVSIEVFPSDHMPTFICERCKFFMNLFYEYKQIVRQADETILQYVRHGTSMEIISWPTGLTNIFRNKVVKTVVEGGATVQVTSQDNSDSDDDEGNVYNIKIGDTPDETNTACVKVVTSKDGKEINEDSNIRGKESEEVDQNQMRGSEKGLEDGCWPCDECNCTYPLQQLLHLHKRQKHRVRTVQCDQCDAKFFSKYDLAAHQLRHTDEMPFQCIACGKKFKRLILLKRHEKHIHSDLPQQVCPSCPATFLSIEELDAHQKRHIRLQRPYDCALCDKKFYEKASLQRHKDVVHNKTPTYCCEYCPERFVSVTKLARHVRSHAGERPYPCKFCNKCFTKSHHYTRHLRLKHREINRSGRGPFGETELYRCEQCEDTFSTQDDLIYHSAIHATQNLTCPLCQEKFEDVDAVTSHIKSHVNGEEFSCDFCELVFTSKEKLEIHTLKRHEDEMQDMSADDSSVEIQGEEDDECDNEINVKDKGDHMLIEIKKAEDFMIDNTKEDIEDKPDVTNSEESESETTYTELSTVNTLAILKKDSSIVEEKPASKTITITSQEEPVKTNTSKSDDTQTASILRKAEEMKRKVVQQTLDTVIEKREKPVTKVETPNTGGASDKSLRLLEKELQDLKRTNSRTEITKNPTKSSEIIRNKRPQVHTSTPKLKVTEEKKLPLRNKSPAFEKKLIEKRVITKENKEPKETKEPKNNNGNNKEDKDNKDKETPKSVYKNGSNNEKINSEEGIRRSTRPSKIKNYAKMIRERSQVEDNDDTSEDDEDYIESDKSLEARFKSRRSSQTPKPAPKPVVPASAPVTAPRKRGRPRKEGPKEIPNKIKKEEIEEVDNSKANNSIKPESSTANKDEMETEAFSNEADNNKNLCKTPPEQKPAPSDVLVSPTGQTLKKVPIKALPPGVKPLPLPINARPMATGELCEMQIGKKLVKVQKIVMTKAEVEAMAKKGLVEMKDGTMVLKQGIKLPTVESSAIKPTVNLVGDGETEKESIRTEKATPTRCDLGDES